MHVLALTVSIHHDLLDYLAAFGGLVGGFAAVAALVLAGQSKRDSARSATAAEETKRLANEQVAIMRREATTAEAERSLRALPEIQLSARAMLTNDIEPPDWVILTLEFSNENGTRRVDHLSVNLLVPDSIELQTSRDGDGTAPGPGRVLRSPPHQLGEHRGAVFWADGGIGPIGRREHIQRYVKLVRPRPGRHEIQAELMNEDLPNGQSFYAWTLEVPKTGDRVQIHPIPAS